MFTFLPIPSWGLSSSSHPARRRQDKSADTHTHTPMSRHRNFPSSAQFLVFQGNAENKCRIADILEAEALTREDR